MPQPTTPLSHITTHDLLEDMKIRVCDACLQASCWLFIFCCDENKTAGVTEKSVAELRALGRESPDYWAKEIRSRYGRP